MDDPLETANRALHDLERKLSLTLMLSLTYTSHSHGSVVHDPQHTGAARQNIQLLVLQYIRDQDFDPELVYLDRKQRFATAFAREYSPSDREAAPALALPPAPALAPNLALPITRHVTNRSMDRILQHLVLPPAGQPAADASPVSASPENLNDSPTHNFDAYYEALASDDELVDPYDVINDLEDEIDNMDNMLLALPPRLPPREMDPNKLYGLFDFSGPDPLHCTLARDEPVYLINDSDNYWWLVKKLTWHERAALGLPECLEEGKIGFVPAECLETYGERLARLNCFKNEELERTNSALEPPPKIEVSEPTLLARLGLILKRAGALRGNKLVTFENLGLLVNDSDSNSDVAEFSDQYYFGRDDLGGYLQPGAAEPETLSDVYPVMPLDVAKPRMDLAKPRIVFGDDASIGLYSPDTPPARKHRANSDSTADSDAEGNLRRSLILDRLTMVTQPAYEPAFGGLSDTCSDYEMFLTKLPDAHASDVELEDPGSRKLLSTDEINTPQTSVMLLPCVLPKLGTPEKRRKPMEFYLPILGKLDELTEKLAELEHTLGP